LGEKSSHSSDSAATLSFLSFLTGFLLFNKGLARSNPTNISDKPILAVEEKVGLDCTTTFGVVAAAIVCPIEFSAIIVNFELSEICS
jgi:hypothetical protein